MWSYLRMHLKLPINWHVKTEFWNTFSDCQKYLEWTGARKIKKKNGKGLANEIRFMAEDTIEEVKIPWKFFEISGVGWRHINSNNRWCTKNWKTMKTANLSKKVMLFIKCHLDTFFISIDVNPVTLTLVSFWHSYRDEKYETLRYRRGFSWM